MVTEIDKTFHVQNFIRKVIQNTLEQWSNEKLLITIESFKRKRDCLVIIKVRESGKKHHYLKSALSLRDHNIHQLEDFLSFIHNL